MNLFTKERRDNISKAFFDIFKFTVVAGCVSGFFRDFSPVLRWGILTAALVAFIVGFFSCVSEEKENK